MFGISNAFDDIFNFHRETTKLFRDMWADVSRYQPNQYSINVETSDDSWRINVPLPGIDPKDVTVDVAGNTLSIRAEQSGGQHDGERRYDRAITLPQSLDVDKITASHRHGLLQLMVPLKESVRPRRLQIEIAGPAQQKQLTTS